MALAPTASAASAARGVERRHHLGAARDQRGVRRMPRLAAVVTAPPPIGLVRKRHVAGAARSSCARPRRDATTPVTAMPYLGSGSSIEWPPTIGHAGRRGDVGAAAQDLAQHLAPELLERERDQVEGGQRPRAHRVDVRERVGGGDPAEVVWVVDDRREEVDRLDDRQLVADAVDAGVVARSRRRPAAPGRSSAAAPRAMRAARPGRSCRRSPRRARARSAAVRQPLPPAYYRRRDARAPFSDEQLRAAIEALIEPERFRRGRAPASPRPRPSSSGSCGGAGRGRLVRRSPRAAAGEARGDRGPEERLAALRTLLAEETRIGMMVGVAVGLGARARAGRYSPERPSPLPNPTEATRHGHPLSRPRDVRAVRRRHAHPDRPVPGAEQPQGARHAPTTWTRPTSC